MISIDMLPDDVLLEIFDFYVVEDDSDSEDEDEDESEGEGEGKEDEFKQEMEEWQTLVHVCQRWRSIVFRSPRRLNLRLVCTRRTPVRDTLDLWPSFPLLIWDYDNRVEGVDEIIAVLKHSDRVVEIHFFGVDGSEWENMLAAMQVPFLELTRLLLHSRNEISSTLPDSFLGESAPRLESLMLRGIPYPGLLKLLLSATHLVDLHLENIPHSGYISPEAMVTALSALTSLARLSLEFESPQSRPHWASRRPPPLTRSSLPEDLISIQFKGVCEYLEDLVARIDTPQLKLLKITLFNQIVFDTPQFIQFISRTSSLGIFEEAFVVFEDDAASVILSSQTSDYGSLNVEIPCKELDWQISSMEQVCTLCLPPFSSLEDLYIYDRPPSQPVLQDNIENALWLELLQPFITVKNLYLSEKFASRIMPALQELIGSRTAEVLPALQNIFLETLQPSGTVQAAIQQFVATRRITSHSIVVSRWDNSERDMARYF